MDAAPQTLGKTAGSSQASCEIQIAVGHTITMQKQII